MGVTNTVDVIELEIHDGTSKTFTGAERGVLNDGAFGVSDWAEILVLVEIDWGGNHGSTFWVWNGEYHFRHVGGDTFHAISQTRHRGSTDFDLAPFRAANPASSPVNASIGTHFECTPFTAPTYTVQTFEVDKGSSWVTSLIGAATGAAAGGGVPGALVKSVVTSGLEGINPNDKITTHIGSGPDPAPKTPYAVIEFRNTSATYAVTSGCGGTTTTPVSAILSPPVGPSSTGYLALPEQYFAMATDHYFTDKTLPSMWEAAVNTDNEALFTRYHETAWSGVDHMHEFGRNAGYAAMRFQMLADVLPVINQQDFETSEIPELEFENRRELARDTVVGTAYLAAAQVWAEAGVRELDSSILDTAGEYFSAAANSADNGDHQAAIAFYRDAACFLMKGLYPSFNKIAVPSPSDTRLVSRGLPGLRGNAESSGPALSSNGEILGFASESTNLVPGDFNDVSDIFIRGRIEGTLVRASVDSYGTEANAASSAPSLSGDGSVVAFVSQATNLIATDTNSLSDIFIHDTATGRTVCASLNLSGNTGNGNCREPSISADGRWVAFVSDASDLVTGDTNGTADIFLFDRMSGTTTRVSTDETGNQVNGGSSVPYLSGNGSLLVFASNAPDLITGDTNGAPDVFLKNLISGAVERVSVGPGGSQVTSSQLDEPTVSDDGRWVAFASDAPNLVTGVSPELTQIFLHDRTSGTTSLVSQSSGGNPGDGDHLFPRVSSDGKFVVFSSDSGNLVAGANGGERNVYLFSRESNTFEVASRMPGGGAGNGDSGGFTGGLAISSEGEAVAFESEASNLIPNDNNSAGEILLYLPAEDSIIAGSTSSLPTNADGPSQFSSIDEEGSQVAFASDATNLVEYDTNGMRDVFLFDRATERIRLVSHDPFGDPGNGASSDPSLSGDGRYMVFASFAENLTPSDTNGASDIFLVDLETDELTLVSGPAANGDSYNPVISYNGKNIAFVSTATNLVPGDTNNYSDVFVYDIASGVTTLASVADGTDEQGNGDSGAPRMSGEAKYLSGNGRFVAFPSMAENLTLNDANGNVDVYVRDLLEGRTFLVSHRPDGESGNEGSDSPSVSKDGRTIAFSSEASNLVPNDLNDSRDVFIWSLESEEVSLASQSNDAQQGNNGSGYDGLSLAPRSGILAFSSLAGNLITNDPNDASDIFTTGFSNGTVRGITVGEGPVPGTNHHGPSLGSNGAWISYSSDTTNLPDPPQRNVYLRQGEQMPTFAPVNLLDLSWENSPVLSFTWGSQSGLSYAIDSSADLRNWTPVVENIESQGSTTSYTGDILPGGIDELYFRIRRE